MMRFLVMTGLALAIATPAFAGDSDPQAYQNWQQNVAKAEAYRLNELAQDKTATQHAALGNSASATDAATGSRASQPAPGATAGAAGYGVGLRAAGGCPGTDAAGGPWHPGEYCLPGGR
jgi:hypothetical protein